MLRASTPPPSPRVVPLAGLALVLLPCLLALFALAGCQARPGAFARTLPRVLVRARLGHAPRSVAVEALADFPLRRVRVGSALSDAEALAEVEGMARALDAAVDLSESKGPYTALAREVPCRRPDTCAWQRERTARVIAAWGAAR